VKSCLCLFDVSDWDCAVITAHLLSVIKGTCMVCCDRLIEHEILTNRLVMCTRNMWLSYVWVFCVNSDLECNPQTIGRYKGINVFEKSDNSYVNKCSIERNE